MIETDSLLVRCPQCGAWPMAANMSKISAQREIRFRCSRCRHQDSGRLRRAGNAQQLAQHQPHATPTRREMR